MRAGISSPNNSSRRSGIRLRFSDFDRPSSGRAFGGPTFSLREKGRRPPLPQEEAWGEGIRSPSGCLEPRRAAAASEFAHSQDIALALGYRYRAARVEQVEDMARLDALIVGRKRHKVAFAGRAPLEQRHAFRFGVPKMLEENVGVGVFEVEAGIFLFSLLKHVAVRHALRALAAVEVEVVDALDALHIHRQPLEAVSQFAGHRRAFETRDLLEIGELRHFHAVAPAFPSQAPRAKRRALPIV